MMPSEPAMDSADHRRRSRDHTAEHEEEHHCHQRHGQHFGPLLVLGDGPHQPVGQRRKPASFTSTPGMSKSC
jgi:hypothetical protein